MTIVFFWTGYSTTMAACWRALAALPGIRLVVYLELPTRADTAYRYDELLRDPGFECRVRSADEPLDTRGLAAELEALRPDACIILGWRSRMCRAAAASRGIAAVPKLLAFDMPFSVRLRKLVAPLVLRPYLRRFRGAFVPGERAAASPSTWDFRSRGSKRGSSASTPRRMPPPWRPVRKRRATRDGFCSSAGMSPTKASTRSSRRICGIVARSPSRGR